MSSQEEIEAQKREAARKLEETLKKGRAESGTSKGKDVVDLEDLDSIEMPEAVLMTRLQRLHAMLEKQRDASRVTNVSFEIGRPELQPAEGMRSNPSNPYDRPSIDQLYKIKPRAVSNNMANTEELMKVRVAIEGLGVPTEFANQVIFQACCYCKSTSSSMFLNPSGTIEFPGGAIMLDAVLAVMKRDAETLRRVCRLYAPVVWNHMLIHNAPPSDWAAMGFQYETRYAAFDFFDYVENEAAIQPLEGLIRRPTPAEKVAYATHKRIALDRANRNQTYANLETEVTGGRLGPEISRNFNNANNK